VLARRHNRRTKLAETKRKIGATATPNWQNGKAATAQNKTLKGCKVKKK